MLAPTSSDFASRLAEAARFHDYRYASNPLADGTLPPIPGVRFPATLHEQGPTRTIPLDASDRLLCPGPATAPGLCANFVHVRPGECHFTDANATSQLFFVMRGEGMTRLGGDEEFALAGEGDEMSLGEEDASGAEAGFAPFFLSGGEVEAFEGGLLGGVAIHPVEVPLVEHGGVHLGAEFFSFPEFGGGFAGWGDP